MKAGVEFPNGAVGEQQLREASAPSSSLNCCEGRRGRRGGQGWLCYRGPTTIEMLEAIDAIVAGFDGYERRDRVVVECVTSTRRVLARRTIE